MIEMQTIITRRKAVLDTMKEQGIRQLLVTDPASVYYLTGHYEEPMERFWALYLHESGLVKVAANRLFTLPEISEEEIVWHADGESGVETLIPYIEKTEVLYVDGSMKARFLLACMENGAAAGFRDGSEVMKQVRACKDSDEQAKMLEASKINDLAMEKFKALIRPGVTERQVAEQMLTIYRSLGAQDYSFEPLVAFGANAACGHHGPDDTVLKEGDCVLLDVGCKKDGYCSDMTRTFFFGEPDGESRKVYFCLILLML